MANRWGNSGNSEDRLYFLVSEVTADGDSSHEIKRCLLLGRKVMTNLDSVLKSGDIALPTKVWMDSQNHGFFSSHVWMWELDHEEGWAPKKWCFCTVVLEKTIESHLDSKEVKPGSPQGIQSWIFFGRTDARAEALIFWPPDVKSRLFVKEPDVGKDWGQEEKGWQRMRWLDDTFDSMDMCLSKLWEIVRDRENSHAAVLTVARSLTWLSDWTTRTTT